jgi:hypothetical protein
VSEGTVPGIDPRFDPRFQRGYVADAAAPASLPPTAPTTPSVSPARAADPPADDPAAAILELLAKAEAQRLTPSGREPDDPADDPAGVEPVAAPVAFTEADHEQEPVVEMSPSRWLWIAIGACVSFVVLGSVLFWVQASDPATFMGGRAGIDETVRAMVSALSPALVQAGVLGVVVVLVVWAVRGRRPAEDLP